MIDHLSYCHYFEFLLSDERMRLPLGWLLSDRAKSEIERQVMHSEPVGDVLLQLRS
jgi:hypothetical protein